MSNRVLASFENDAKDHCVDVFVRPDGTFGFEEYRRDAEDGTGWFPLHHYAAQVFASEGAALAQAKATVAWLAADGR
jgi:hypothetical protein